MAPARQEDTDRHAKRDGTKLWLPIGVVATILLVVGGSAVTWATDRAELRMANKTSQDNAKEILILREEKARAEERNKALDKRLQNIEEQLSKIADKLNVR